MLGMFEKLKRPGEVSIGRRLTNFLVLLDNGDRGAVAVLLKIKLGGQVAERIALGFSVDGRV